MVGHGVAAPREVSPEPQGSAAHRPLNRSDAAISHNSVATRHDAGTSPPPPPPHRARRRLKLRIAGTGVCAACAVCVQQRLASPKQAPSRRSHACENPRLRTCALIDSARGCAAAALARAHPLRATDARVAADARARSKRQAPRRTQAGPCNTATRRGARRRPPCESAGGRAGGRTWAWTGASALALSDRVL